MFAQNNLNQTLSESFESRGIPSLILPGKELVVPALRRALEVNQSNRPAYIEFLCSQFPIYGDWVGR